MRYNVVMGSPRDSIIERAFNEPIEFLLKRCKKSMQMTKMIIINDTIIIFGVY